MEKANRGLVALNVITAIVMLISLWLIFFYAPLELTMGPVQRVFYWHAPAGLAGYLAFFVTMVAGIAYLVTGRRWWDHVGAASVEIGLVFTVMNIASGSIWARPAWNTWWTWEPRLTTAAIMTLLYVAYLMLRQGIEDPDRRARFAAVYGIIGFVSAPISYFSIHWWRTLHPAVVGTGSPTAEGGFDMVSSMAFVFVYCSFAFVLLYFCFLANRLRLARFAERVDEMKARLLSA